MVSLIQWYFIIVKGIERSNIMCYPRLNNLPSIKRDFDAILNDWTVCDVGKYSSRTTVNRSPNKLSSNFISASVSKECEQLRYPCGLSWDIKISNLFLIMLFQWSQVQISDYFNSSIRNATKHIFSFLLTWIVGIRRVYKQIATSERLTFTLIRKARSGPFGCFVLQSYRCLNKI